MKIPFYKTGKFMAGSAALVVATAVTLVMVLNDKSDTTKDKAFVSPPLAQADIQRDGFTVDAESDTLLEYKSGSKIHIPANAFKDAAGNLVKGKVDIKYREFHDQKDIFISGIPMTYDSAGVNYVFESAGMMEITATQNGKTLSVNEEKPIKVDMVSNTAEDRYSTYYLDTVTKKWVNINQVNFDPKQVASNCDSSTGGHAAASSESDVLSSNPVIAKCQQEVKKAEIAVKECEKEKPAPLVKAEKDKTKFHIVVDASEFPEIAMYKGVRFQVKDEASFDKGSAKIEWEDVKLKKMSGIDYQVTFTKGTKVYSVIATPVIDDKDMAAAQKVYDEKFAQYQSKLTERKTAEAKARQEMEARAKDMEAQMQKAISEEKERVRLYEASLNRTQLVYRTFSVYRFGTYNCDSPVGWPTEANVIASLTDEKGDKLNVCNLSLVEKGRNAVFPYYAVNGQCDHFKFNASKDNLIWAVTTDNKLAVVDVSSFKAQQSKGGTVQFKFKLVDKDFKSSDEVKKFLEI